MKMVLSIPYFMEDDRYFCVALNTRSPRTISGRSLKNLDEGALGYENISTSSTFASHEVIRPWQGGVSSSKRLSKSKRLSNGKQLGYASFLALKMKRLQPEREKNLDPEIKRNLDGLGYSDLLRSTYGPYCWALDYQESAALSQDSFLADGTFRLTQS